MKNLINFKKTYPILQPKYFDKFKCSCNDCKINCCNYSWRIFIDKKRYKKCQKIKKNHELKFNLENYLKINKKSTANFDYAYIEHLEKTIFINIDSESGTKKMEAFVAICPFKNKENGLCTIQEKLGLPYLCETCKTFPRLTFNINNNISRAFNICCEEVCSLLYNEVEGIQFEIKDTPYYEISSFKIINIEKEKALFLDKVRTIAISIMQIKDFYLDEKMIFLAKFLFDCDNFINNNEYDKINTYLDDFLSNEENYESLLSHKQINQKLFLSITISILDIRKDFFGNSIVAFEIFNIFHTLLDCFVNKISPKFLSLIDENNKELHFKTFKNREEKPIKCIEEDEKNWISIPYCNYIENRENILADKEYYIENVFVNLFFANGYPFSFDSIKNTCLKFIYSYCLFKAMLNAAFADKKDFETDTLFKTTVVFGRIFSDLLNNSEIILETLDAHKIDTLEDVILLIKSS